MTSGKTIALTYMDVCWQSDVSAFLIHQVCLSFPSKEQGYFIFMAAVTVCSSFGAQENKICHYFHFFSSIGHAVMVLDAMILAFLSAEL